MGKGRSKSFKPQGKDKSRLKGVAASKKARKPKESDKIFRGRIETPKSERRRVKRIAYQLQNLPKNDEVDVVMKDITEVAVSKAQRKKSQRKADNQKIMLVEEEVRSTMDIDATMGTELGAPL